MDVSRRFSTESASSKTTAAGTVGNGTMVEHTLFVCEEWDKEKLALMQKTPWPTIDTVLQFGEAWDAVASFVRRVLTENEKRERKRKEKGRPPT
jgi:hypothetical protein